MPMSSKVLIPVFPLLSLSATVWTRDSGADLAVHVVQASGGSAYAFVRAKFEPGEVADPWAVEFTAEDGRALPMFVWDTISWRVAREGRDDWGRRYAAIQHFPGRSLEARAARSRRLAAAEEHVPELGAALAARERGAAEEGDSVAAVLYLLKVEVPPFAKLELRLRVLSEPRSPPRRWSLARGRVLERTDVAQGPLRFEGLPDRLKVTWKGRELIRYAGYRAGGAMVSGSHADPAEPFSLEVTEGLITKLRLDTVAAGGSGAAMEWQCTYWLFPEGVYVALEGFSLREGGYLGGDEVLSVLEAREALTPVHAPRWEAPWHLFRAAGIGAVAIHQFPSVTLACGYGNNPFTASPGGSEKVVLDGERLELHWSSDLTRRGVYRLFHRGLPVPTPQEPDPPWLTREALRTGRIPPSSGLSQREREALEEALAYVRWEPRVDWLYRQYVVSVAETPAEAEAALRHVIAAAAGWIDRPFREEEVAEMLAESVIRDFSSRGAPRGHGSVYDALPYWLGRADAAGARQVLHSVSDPKDAAARQMETIRNHIAAGQNGISGPWVSDPHGEGWHSNPAYHACGMPTELRVLEHFDLLPLARYRAEEYEAVLLEFADFSAGVLGGTPFDPSKLRGSFRLCWPNRMVMLLPLVAHAERLRPDETYRRAATLLFDELLSMAERNPHGYWAAWTFDPEAGTPFDTVYNPVAYQRGISAFWCEGLLETIGRDRAARFVAAQARYLVASGQFLDSFEAESHTAVHANFHHAHPSFAAQLALYLYDDFEFYRGLTCEALRWIVARGGPGRDEYYSPLLRWAFGIHPGSKWFERRVEGRGAGRVRVRMKSELPWARNSTWVSTQDAGIEPAWKWLLWLELRETTFRLEAVLDFEKCDERLVLDVSRRMRLRVYYSLPFPAWKGPESIVLSDAGRGALHEDVEWSADGTGERFAEWDAVPGRYELRPR